MTSRNWKSKSKIKKKIVGLCLKEKEPRVKGWEYKSREEHQNAPKETVFQFSSLLSISINPNAHYTHVVAASDMDTAVSGGAYGVGIDESYRPLPWLYLAFLSIWFVSACSWTLNTYKKRQFQVIILFLR